MTTKHPTIRAHFSSANDVTLYTGDCLRLLREIPESSVQLVVTSPPYNLGKIYEGKQSIEDYLSLQRAVIDECVRITRPGGSICWQVGNHINGHQQIIPIDILLHPIFAVHERSNQIRLRNRIVWHFEHGLHCLRRFSGRYETILWYTKGDDYAFNLDAVRVTQKYPGKRAYRGRNKGQYSGNPLGKNPGDLWIFPNVKSNHVEKTNHPCQFPVELPTRLVLALSNPNDLVVDPFMGVGSTAIAAVLNGRRFAGSDVVNDYVKTSRRRVRQALRGTLKIRDAFKPVYQPANGTSLTTPPPHFQNGSVSAPYR